MHTSPVDLSLPAPAVDRKEGIETGPVTSAHIMWKARRESEEEQGDMKEATARALEFARKMFRSDAESRLEDGKNSEHVSAEME
jgi:hypothetical protein